MNKNDRHKIISSVVPLVLSFVLLVSATFAWFSSDNSQTGTEARLIDNPPVLYLFDYNAEDKLSLDLNGLIVGQPSRFVFCISSVGINPTEQDILNDVPDINTTKAINLEVAYTSNLNAIFSISPVSYSATGSDGEQSLLSQHGTRFYYNPGEIIAEASIKNEDSYGVTYKYFEPVRYTNSYHFFTLNITWPENYNGANFHKETDAVYIIAKGGYMPVSGGSN